MKKKLFITLCLGLLLTSFVVPKSQKKYKAIHSGIALFDQNNNEVNAHGSCIVKEGGKYYLFGECHTDTSNAFIGFSCYSSDDLMNWNFEKMVLPVQKDGILGPNRVGERVKVMKCPKTGEYVMYMHTDDMRYKNPRVGYATCKTINGEYQFHGALPFNGKDIHKWDLGTFQDADGKGYLLTHSGFIYELNDDYKSVKRIATNHKLSGESPAMFKCNGTYFWLFSHKTSWERNDNYYLTAKSIEGPWTKKSFFAPKGTLTWNSQSSFVLPVESGKDTLYMFMGDRWSYPKQGSAATYVWQPITVKGEEMSIPEFQEAWKLGRDFAGWEPLRQGTTSVIGKCAIGCGNWNVEKNVYRSKEKGAILSCPFTGGQIGIKAVSNSSSGYARVAIRKNGKEVLTTIMDCYSKYEYSSQKFLSPVLPAGNYVLTIEVLGERPTWSDKKVDFYGSTDDYVTIEDIYAL